MGEAGGKVPGENFLELGPPALKLLAWAVITPKQKDGGCGKSLGFKFKIP